MLLRADVTRRRALFVEELEPRLVLAGSLPGYTVALDPQLDQFGDQILTVQAYAGPERLAFGIFDTGSAAITFSAADQESFLGKGTGIPIQRRGGAMAQGLGGSIVGDVSYPDAVLADGLHAVRVWFDNDGNLHSEANFTYASAVATGVQCLVGIVPGSELLPTITGTPILNASAFAPAGLAALIDMEGLQFDFTLAEPGLLVRLPDLLFVSPATVLGSIPGSTQAFVIPIGFYGHDNSLDPGDMITEAPNPMQPDVQLTAGDITLDGMDFLFDTGAQMTVISTSLAAALGLDLANPQMTIAAQGVSGPADIPGFVLDKLTLPSAAGPLVFEHAPVFVADVAQGLDGILGMNLFNTALKMLYNPWGGAAPTLSVLFPANATEVAHGPSLGDDAEDSLRVLGIPFGGLPDNTSLPTFTVASGEITGQVYEDDDLDGSPDDSEPGLEGETVFIDENDNGALDDNEPSTTTDGHGDYHFGGLLPGTYPLRILLDPHKIPTFALRDAFRVIVGQGGVTRGGFFGAVPASPDEGSAFVTGLYTSLLDRVPDFLGMQYWLGRMRDGLPRNEIARAVWESDEHRSQQILRYYVTYLQRTPDDPGWAYWIDGFRHGLRERDVERGFLTSAEYLAKAPDANTFINSLYIDVLGRAPDQIGRAYWQGILAGGGSNDQVAYGILTSEELSRKRLDSFYSRLLHRAADDDGMNYWLGQVQQLTWWESVAASFLSSEEYLGKQRLRLGLQNESGMP